MFQTLSKMTAKTRAFVRKPSVVHLLPMTHQGLRWTNSYHKMRQGRSARERLDALLVKVPDNGLRIPEDDGFAVLDLSGDKVMKKALALCRKHYSKDFIAENCSKPSKQDTLLCYRLDLSDSVNNPIRELVTHPGLVRPIGEYLGTTPVLLGAYVWLSRNSQNFDLVASQLHHFDRDGWQQVKCFIPIDPIDRDCGPLTVISATDSRRFVSWLSESEQGTSLKQRFPDELVSGALGDHFERKMTGESGNVVFVDTTTCLHYGSRPGNRPKYHIMLQYVTPFSHKVSDVNWRQDFGGDPNKVVLAAQDR